MIYYGQEMNNVYIRIRSFSSRDICSDTFIVPDRDEYASVINCMVGEIGEVDDLNVLRVIDGAIVVATNRRIEDVKILVKPILSRWDDIVRWDGFDHGDIAKNAFSK